MGEAASPVENHASTSERARDILFAAAAIGASLLVFGFVFNRATVLSYSIGYNLYGAERVLGGEVPYRDFHTLYPPATVYVNAALFRLLGTSLYSAMIGVLAFKLLTILMLYLSGREIMPRSWALAATVLSVFWLRPNGAFKSVPMQYGALFLATGLLLLLKHENHRRTIYVVLAGVALGALTLFKHNIGIYTVAGYLMLILLDRRAAGGRLKGDASRRVLGLAAGFAAVIGPTLLYMQSKGALAPMTRTLLLGPGEFLASRLAFPRSPVVSALFALVLAASAYAAFRLRARRVIASLLWLALIVAISVFALFVGEPAMNNLIFYVPMFIFVGALLVFAFDKQLGAARNIVFITLLSSAAAFAELFPRFAREQSIGAMPFVILLLVYLLYNYRAVIERFSGGALAAKFALAVLPLTFFLVGARLFFGTYFERNLSFKSDTELTIERGRGVRFPRHAAQSIDQIVNYIKEHVPNDGYVFAQSNGGSAYLFLSARRNASSAQFWGGVGVSPAARAATIEEINSRQVRLIITSDEAMAGEEYAPLRDYLHENFKQLTRFNDVVILER